MAKPHLNRSLSGAALVLGLCASLSCSSRQEVQPVAADVESESADPSTSEIVQGEPLTPVTLTTANAPAPVRGISCVEVRLHHDHFESSTILDSLAQVVGPNYTINPVDEAAYHYEIHWEDAYTSLDMVRQIGRKFIINSGRADKYAVKFDGGDNCVEVAPIVTTD